VFTIGLAFAVLAVERLHAPLDRIAAALVVGVVFRIARP